MVPISGKHFPNENEKGKGRARVTTRPSKNDGVLREGELVRSDSQHLDVLAPSKHRLSVHRDEIVGNIRDESWKKKVAKKRGNYGKGCGLRAMGEWGGDDVLYTLFRRPMIKLNKKRINVRDSRELRERKSSVRFVDQ
ncbi:hypothetical protein HZH68_009396 [Vespula germanica]|uniref:Uncharacterized protein n=1 Tax=Vespula germanica TaxID=30212 RepID=A0A834JVR3_VESGE|nr:hypothetical protein HZH68_009396 [Vespula germanica]